MLKMRLCDLPLVDVEKTLRAYKKKMQQELQRRGLKFDFHLWVSDEWFCPDGVPGIALPFYLFHPQLIKLEKQELGFVEGKTERQRMKLLRHELGHCIDNAFRLRRNKERQELFGSSKQAYPESYSPKKYSRHFVRYLGDGYAQSHPDEDFAETFAVWLDPQINWRKLYKGTKAYQKLELMDRMMKGLRGQKPFLKNKFKVDAIEKQTHLLKDYFSEKKKRLHLSQDPHFDRNLQRFFSSSQNTGSVSLSDFLKQEKGKIEGEVSRRAGVYRYQVQFVLNKTIERAEKIKVYGTKEQLSSKAPLLIEKNFRYLSEKQQLKFYL